MLILKNVTKQFNHFKAINDITLSLTEGVYGLLGVNGAGKTTLMEMIASLSIPTDGLITWNGENIFSLGAVYRNELGYLPQDFAGYPDLSIRDYLLYIGSLKGLSPRELKRKMPLLLEEVGLSQKEKNKLRTLSGGMLRRVGIAQALLNNPSILILDEPTAGLDPNERIRFRQLINQLGNNRIVLFSTHIVSDIEFIAKEIILLKEGTILFQGELDAILKSVQIRVWRHVVPQKELEKLANNYLISNTKAVANGIEVRLLSDIPPHSDATEEDLTLEDAFLYYFKETSGGQ